MRFDRLAERPIRLRFVMKDAVLFFVVSVSERDWDRGRYTQSGDERNNVGYGDSVKVAAAVNRRLNVSTWLWNPLVDTPSLEQRSGQSLPSQR